MVSMKYCKECVFPAVAATPLTFDEKGVCSGCRANKHKKFIDYSKKDKAEGQIEITDKDQGKEKPAELSGLYDPGKNDLSLGMWSNTNGTLIKDTLKRITKTQLSNFSEKLFRLWASTSTPPTSSNPAWKSNA